MGIRPRTLILTCLIFVAGMVVGVGCLVAVAVAMNSSAASVSAQAQACHEARAKRARAQDALTRGHGDFDTTMIVHINARRDLGAADREISAHCR